MNLVFFKKIARGLYAFICRTTVHTSKQVALMAGIFAFFNLFVNPVQAQQTEEGHKELWLHDPYVLANSIRHMPIVDGDLPWYMMGGMKGNIKSLTQKSYWTEKGPNKTLVPKRPNINGFLYFVFNTDHEIIESWKFDEDTIPATKYYYRSFKWNLLDSTASGNGDYQTKEYYAPDGTPEGHWSSGREKYEYDKSYFGPDSCCRKIVRTICYVKGKKTFEKNDYDQYKRWLYHPNGLLKLYEYVRTIPDTFPICQYEYDENGYLRNYCRMDWDWMAAKKKFFGCDTFTYNASYHLDQIKRVTLKNGELTTSFFHFIYENGNLTAVEKDSAGKRVVVETYKYNEHGLDLRTVYPGTGTFEYDDHGNWIKMIDIFGILRIRNIEYYD
jgi:hypothetical protein